MEEKVSFQLVDFLPNEKSWLINKLQKSLATIPSIPFSLNFIETGIIKQDVLDVKISQLYNCIIVCTTESLCFYERNTRKLFKKIANVRVRSVIIDDANDEIYVVSEIVSDSDPYDVCIESYVFKYNLGKLLNRKIDQIWRNDLRIVRPCIGIAFYNDNSNRFFLVLFKGWRSGALFILDSKTGETLETMYLHYTATAMAINSYNELIISTTSGLICVYSFESSQTPRFKLKESHKIDALNTNSLVCCCESDRDLMLCCENSSLPKFVSINRKLWTVQKTIQDEKFSGVKGMCFDESCGELYVNYGDKGIVIYK